jgi:hypothetical protein
MRIGFPEYVVRILPSLILQSKQREYVWLALGLKREDLLVEGHHSSRYIL